MSDVLSPVQEEMLTMLAKRSFTIDQFADATGRRKFAISNTRTVLRDAGLIEKWADYNEPMHLTTEGWAVVGLPQPKG